MKKIIATTILVATILFLIFSLLDRKVFANTSCEEEINELQYFNATLYNYNAINFNSYARGYTIEQFNQLSEEERISIDKKEAAEKVVQKNSELENNISNSLFFIYLNIII